MFGSFFDHGESFLHQLYLLFEFDFPPDFTLNFLPVLFFKQVLFHFELISFLLEPSLELFLEV